MRSDEPARIPLPLCRGPPGSALFCAPARAIGEKNHPHHLGLSTRNVHHRTESERCEGDPARGVRSPPHALSVSRASARGQDVTKRMLQILALNVLPCLAEPSPQARFCGRVAGRWQQ